MAASPTKEPPEGVIVKNEEIEIEQEDQEGKKEPEEDSRRETFVQIEKQLDAKKKKGKMIKDENEEVIKITWRTYRNYFGKYYGGLPFLATTNVSMVLYCLSSIGCDYIVGDWTSLKDQKARVGFYSGVSLAFAFSTALSVTMRVSAILCYSLSCDKKLHE